MNTLKQQIIAFLLEKGIIKTNFKQPITFKSKIKSPIYCDFRKSSSYPELMEMIARGFRYLSEGKDIDGVIGVATGAISHATHFALKNNLPSGYIRPGATAKDYGLGNLIEGLEVSGKSIKLIEDLVTSGGSVIENARILEKAGAREIEISSIFSYSTKKADQEFADAGFTYTSIITIHDVLPELQKILSTEEFEMLEDWVRDPDGWFNRHKTKFDFGYLTFLRMSAQKTKSLICMGLDPVVEALPVEQNEIGTINDAIGYFKILLHKMKEKNILPATFKPNEGFFSKFDNKGDTNGSQFLADFTNKNSINALTTLKLPVIIDCKRGDIGKSSANYAKQYLENMDYDAITISPYMGFDSVEPFIKYCNAEDAKGVYILVRTSNPGAADFQNRKMEDGRPLYQHVADKVIEWAKDRPGVGAVVGATSLPELGEILKMFAGKDIPVLVPGVGAQGGSAKNVAAIAREVGFELELLRINSSSGLTHPWYKNLGDAIPEVDMCIEMCINELKKLNEEVGYQPAYNFKY